MKLILTLAMVVTLTGCCFSLDGKAQASCERAKRAESLCKEHGGITQVMYGESRCVDGTMVKND